MVTQRPYFNMGFNITQNYTFTWSIILINDHQRPGATSHYVIEQEVAKVGQGTFSCYSG